MAVLRIPLIIIVIVAAMVLPGLTPVQAQAPEYQVKAAMLVNFALFVEWPAKALPEDTSPFIVCVLGKDPFGPWLKHELGEARVGTHPVETHRVENAEQAAKCHLVFISRSEQPRMQQVLAKLKNAGVLIVSDISDVSDFCRWGGMIGLVMEDSKVRFELNAGAMEKAGLKIDSKLKRVARSAECGE